MSEEMARALGASSPMTVQIGNKECQVRPLGIKELTEAERDCLERYKDAYVATYIRNAPKLPGGGELLERKLEEAARWDVNNLPEKEAHNPAKVELTAPLKKWLRGQFDLDGAGNNRYKRMAAAALDSEILSAEEYEKLVGKKPVKQAVPYVSWWITGCFEGMITFVWICFRRDGITREQVEDELGHNPALLMEISREIERVTAPDSGNG